MDIKLEKEDEIKYLATGIGQLGKDCSFIQVALAVGNNILYYYSDNCPDDIKGDCAYYKIKRIVELEDIKLVMLETIKNNPELKVYQRLRIISGDEETNTCLYFVKAQRRNAVNIYRYLKYKGIRCRSKSVDLSPLY